MSGWASGFPSSILSAVHPDDRWVNGSSKLKIAAVRKDSPARGFLAWPCAISVNSIYPRRTFWRKTDVIRCIRTLRCSSS